MNRLRLLVPAGLIAELLAVPVAVALASTVLVPTELAPVLAGADLQTDQQTATSSRTAGSEPSAGRGSVPTWAGAQVGLPYRIVAAEPTAWDCFSFTKAAHDQVGARLPRTDRQQRDRLAARRGTRVRPGSEQPADPIPSDSYPGPAAVGHVVLVDHPSRYRTVEAQDTQAGTGHVTHHPHHHQYEIWRLHSQGKNLPKGQQRGKLLLGWSVR